MDGNNVPAAVDGDLRGRAAGEAGTKTTTRRSKKKCAAGCRTYKGTHQNAVHCAAFFVRVYVNDKVVADLEKRDTQRHALDVYVDACGGVFVNLRREGEGR